MVRRKIIKKIEERNPGFVKKALALIKCKIHGAPLRLIVYIFDAAAATQLMAF